MKPILLAALLVALTLNPLVAQASSEEKETARLAECAAVLKEIMNIPEGGIPRDLLDRAECIGIIPSVKKAAFGFGARYGKGAVVCRKGNLAGSWGAPAMYMIGGGSFGLQLGGTSTDFIFLVMNPRGVDKFLQSKFTLGADASAAAGPKGRTAEAATDVQMRAEILTYSRSRGLFAGVSLEGAVVKQDKDGNHKLYGREVGVRQILLRGKVAVPAEAKELVSTLDRYSPKNLSAKPSK